MEKLQDVMVSLDVSREECEGLRQQGPVETSADVNSSAFPSEDELAAVKSTLADRDAELAKAREFRAKAKAKIQDLEGKLAASRAASSANAGGPGASTSGSSEQTDETAVALAKANRINVRAVAKIKDLEASLAASKEAAAIAEARVAAAESASTAGPEDTALVERISELERELDAKTTEMDATVEAAAGERASHEGNHRVQASRRGRTSGSGHESARRGGGGGEGAGGSRRRRLKGG
jgi:valyl-tRNA synthetase